MMGQTGCPASAWSCCRVVAGQTGCPAAAWSCCRVVAGQTGCPVATEHPCGGALSQTYTRVWRGTVTDLHTCKSVGTVVWFVGRHFATCGPGIQQGPAGLRCWTGRRSGLLLALALQKWRQGSWKEGRYRCYLAHSVLRCFRSYE